MDDSLALADGSKITQVFSFILTFELFVSGQAEIEGGVVLEDDVGLLPVHDVLGLLAAPEDLIPVKLVVLAPQGADAGLVGLASLAVEVGVVLEHEDNIISELGGKMLNHSSRTAFVDERLSH